MDCQVAVGVFDKQHPTHQLPVQPPLKSRVATSAATATSLQILSRGQPVIGTVDRGDQLSEAQHADHEGERPALQGSG